MSPESGPLGVLSHLVQREDGRDEGPKKQSPGWGGVQSLEHVALS